MSQYHTISGPPVDFPRTVSEDSASDFGATSPGTNYRRLGGNGISRPTSYHRQSSFVSSHSRNYSFSSGHFPPASDGRRSRTASMASSAAWKPFPTPGLKSKERDPMEDVDYKTVEEIRLDEDEKKERHWKRWGPYLAERQWGTVREDYSHNGDAWTHFPHEQARSRAYRWGEDGIAGLSDNHQRLCFSLGLWNGKDKILKERLFGLTGHQGNHGEDVKELYYYLDSTPTHSYMKFLYKYPQCEFPYSKLTDENGRRGRDVQEYEIMDTDAFEDDKYWDVFVEYAKDEDDENAISIRITAFNRGPEPATLHIVPQVFFRNTWSWPKERPTGSKIPSMEQVFGSESTASVLMNHETLGQYYFHANESPAPCGPPARKTTPDGFLGEEVPGVIEETDDVVAPETLFTDNDTNFERLFGGRNVVPFVKDAFHDHIIPSHRPPVVEHEKVNGVSNGVNGRHSPEDSLDSGQSTPKAGRQFVNPDKKGTKMGAHYTFKDVPPKGGCAVVRVKLTKKTVDEDESIYDEEKFDDNIDQGRLDSDELYSRFDCGPMSDDLRNIMRQALSGMLWNKQFYMFIQKEWMDGDPGQPPPPAERKYVRNKDWKHLHCEDILSMPDKWEYPWFATWDTAFHCVPLAMVDPAYAKKQLDILTREWYMKPDGALPAYEWNFGDVNPPVHAWATFRVFKLERKMRGVEDLGFLERVFQKLLLNFTWWVNRKDSEGAGVFEGGFLGLDNIGIFNRSEPLPTGGVLRQADGTAWMAFYCLQMLSIALELAKHNKTYEDIASKFFEHFILISEAMTYRTNDDGQTQSLWNEKDGFYYDAISWGAGSNCQIPVRSLVGLIPLYATVVLEPSAIKQFPGFKKRMDWFIEHRSELARRNMSNIKLPGKGDRKLLSLVDENRLRRILTTMLDETEFLSEFGIRSLSLFHKDHPYSMNIHGQEFGVSYWPGDSLSGMFGGNSNWRGPIWLATTFLIIESLQRLYQYYGDTFMIECPTGSGEEMNLANVAETIEHRITHLFARDSGGRRANNGGSDKLDGDPHFRDLVQFHEFFHADTGRGLGASHQTGWTGLVAYMIWQSGTTEGLPRTPRTPRSAAAHYFDDIIPATPGGSEFGDSYGDVVDWRRDLGPDEL